MELDPVRVLLVEPDEQKADAFGRFFTARNWRVDHLATTHSVLTQVDDESYHLIFLSLGLQDDKGLNLCEQIRYICDSGLVLLHEVDDPAERFCAYEQGADAYFVKPLAYREIYSYCKNLVSRVKAVLAAKPDFDGQAYWSFSRHNKSLSNINNELIGLSHSECKVLQMLMNNANEPLSRERILTSLGRKKVSPGDRSLDMLISKLRGKLRKISGEDNHIMSQYGHGYIFKHRSKTPNELFNQNATLIQR